MNLTPYNPLPTLHRFGASAVVWSTACVLACLWAGLSIAQFTPTPPALDPDGPPPVNPNVRYGDPSGSTLPLDLTFRDQRGRTVALGELFQPDRPVVVMLGYYRCPHMCDFTMNGMADAFREIDSLTLSEDYIAVCVSINPEEGSRIAATKQERYSEIFDQPEHVLNGWYFLTGEQDSITALAEMLRFEYDYIEAKDEYAHAAAIYIVSPDGMVSKTLPGTTFQTQTMRLALVEAADGKIGSPVDLFLTTCFNFDPNAGQYTPSIFAILRWTAGIFILIVGGILAFAFAAEKKRAARLANRPKNPPTQTPPHPA